MPAGKKSTENGTTTASEKTKKSGAQPRTVFRPPWVKDGSPASSGAGTNSTPPWTKKRDSVVKEDSDNDTVVPNFPMPQLRKVSITKPVEVPQENGKENTFIRPQLKPVKTKESSVPLTKEDSKIKIPKLNSVKVEKMKELPPPPKKDNPDYRQVLHKTPTVSELEKGLSKSKSTHGPPAPPMPPPPPMPKLIDTAPLSDEQKNKLDNLRARPKTRPDWSQLLKNIESGRKLKHVDCNDRSKPLLPAAKAKGQFLYESEKDNAHNVLLKEIQGGIKLKTVKTNDRSKPALEGLRKFRRQMTIEEQIQKSVSMANMPPEEIPPPEEADEMDDIDKVRDDLQSTKQLLASELRNKEALTRENKRLQSRIQHLSKELEIERESVKSDTKVAYKGEENEKLMTTLKAEAAQVRIRNEELEKKFTQAATNYDKTKAELEEAKRRNDELEKEIQEILAGKTISFSAADRRESRAQPNDPDNYGDDEDRDADDDDDGDDDDNEEKKQRRAVRELKLLTNKLNSCKNKEDNAKKERIALKEIMRKHQSAIKGESKKFRTLQKEVTKISAMMKESSEDEEEEDEDEEDEEGQDDDKEEESESESSETESSETEDSESERSQSESEDAPHEKKKENLIGRTRRHENRLNALKKTNFMLKTSAETLQDNLNLQKEKTQLLQEDLDSVLAELG